MGENGVKIFRRDSVYQVACPFCPEQQALTMSINILKRPSRYHCHVCGRAGDVLSFLRDYKKLSLAEAVLELQRFIGEAP
jgi:DNA primase